MMTLICCQCDVAGRKIPKTLQKWWRHVEFFLQSPNYSSDHGKQAASDTNHLNWHLPQASLFRQQMSRRTSLSRESLGESSQYMSAALVKVKHTSRWRFYRFLSLSFPQFCQRKPFNCFQLLVEMPCWTAFVWQWRTRTTAQNLHPSVITTYFRPYKHSKCKNKSADRFAKH